MTDAHMSVGIEHALLRKDAIGRNKVLDERRIDGAAGGHGCLCDSRTKVRREGQRDNRDR
jgi:hypothetical protein